MPLSVAEKRELLALYEAKRALQARNSLDAFARTIEIPGVPMAEDSEEFFSAAHHFAGILIKDSATIRATWDSAGVEMLATPPTGTTGTDGLFAIHFDGTELHVENRTGAGRVFSVSML